MRLARRIFLGLVITLVVLYVAATAVMYFGQRTFQYSPDGQVLALAAAKLPGAELVSIPSADGSAVTGWYEAPQPGKPVILFYKGNTGSFTEEHERYETWVAAGYGFLAFDYRGFPGSPGAISQDNILADALAAFDWLQAKNFPIVIWGRSLGTGPATYVASQRDADALLLETPYYSAVSVAAERYPILPVYWLMSDQFPLNDWMPKVQEPVFVAHGTADRTISVGNGERVYQLAPNKYALWIEPGADHSDLWARGIWNRAEKFFADAEAAAAR